MVGTPTRHLEMVEGVPALRTPNNRPPFQPSLDGLLRALYRVTAREDIVPRGASIRCEVERQHPFRTLREGTHVGLDGIVRDLRVEMCPLCGAAVVWDVSYDRMDGLPVGRRGPRRRNAVVGWYTGKRRLDRQFK